MLKYFIIFSFGFFVTVQATFCTSQEECYDHECCVHILLDKGNCKRRPKGGNSCNLLAKIHNKENEMYKISCMCPEGFECRLGESLLDKAPRCRKSKTTTEIPQTTTEPIVTQPEVIKPTEKPDTETENTEEPDNEIENPGEPDTKIENPDEPDIEIENPEEPDTDIENEIDNF